MALKEMGSEFIPEIYKVKAVCMDDDEAVVCGYYYRNVCDFVDVENGDYEKGLECPTTAYEVDPYTLCRNTGIKVGDECLYEFDLVTYKEPMGTKTCMGYVTFDLFTNSWCVRTSFNFSSKRALRSCGSVAVVGNVMLSGDDAKKFQDYSDADELDYKPEPTVECRSKQYLNRKAREFLPK